MAKILYLEDEEWQVKYTIITVLEREYFHEIELCVSINDAETLLHNEKYDAVVIDIMMDFTNPISFHDSAFSLLEKIRNNDFQDGGNADNIPIIVATGVDEMIMTWRDQTRIKVQRAINGFNIPNECCLRKPFTAEDLNEALTLALSVK